MKKPELLVPAGTYDKMRYAFAYGADAVYAGIPKFSLRARENDFTLEKTKQAISYAHSLNKKIYLTMNIFPHNRKINSFTKMLERVALLKPDGVIMADPGMIATVREKYPHLSVHLSTQANAINWRTVKFWKDLGLTRIILSRELSIDEIKEIKQKVPDIELESFVHGAICIAYSGRCLLSNYFTNRDANQGTCTNACRWEYNIYSEPRSFETEKDIIHPLKGSYYLEEAERPAELMPVDEDEHGTYIMNAKDLSAITILKEMAEAGIDSFKVEGRTKSHYYVSIITRAYRWALEHIANGQNVDSHILQEVYAVANRGYITGFLERHPQQDGQNYEESHSAHQNHQFAGLVDSWNEDKKLARVKARNRFEVGDALELVTPAETIPFQLQEMFDEYGKSIEVAHGGGKDVFMKLPGKVGEFDILRKVLK